MKSDPNCVFCKIVAGEIPCQKIFEDQDVLAFLDIGPLSRGHALVIPKGHFETLAEVPNTESESLGRALPIVAGAIVAATDCLEYNVLQNNGEGAGQVVKHAHFHIIPKYPDGKGLNFKWTPGQLPDDEAEKLAKRIKANIL